MPPQHAQGAADAATLRITRPTFYAMTAAFTALVGMVFWTAGYAAGLRSDALLATLFAMGACAALLVIVLWFLSQLRAIEGVEDDGRHAPGRR